jgi:hypothetical protein
MTIAVRDPVAQADIQAPGASVIRSRKMNSPTLRMLQSARLALSGAVLGAALLGAMFPGALELSLLGAAAGFAAVVAVRAAHMI